MLFQGTIDETDLEDREQYERDWHQRYSNLTIKDKKLKREQKYVDALKEREARMKIKVRQGFENEIEESTSEVKLLVVK